ncbi:MAG: hypothetical protein EA397_00710 [Deltaproteobacteria bacterium]|nr:MAG: hypothetical protein EA397_00710 [Deltaproteobacteria bacterium]
MALDNPFDPPAGGGRGPTPPYDSHGPWVVGNELVTGPDATLPAVCVKCGSEDGVRMVHLKGQWAPF